MAHGYLCSKCIIVDAQPLQARSASLLAHTWYLKSLGREATECLADNIEQAGPRARALVGQQTSDRNLVIPAKDSDPSVPSCR